MEELKRLIAESDKLIEDLQAWAIVAHAITITYDKGDHDACALGETEKD